MLTKNKSTILKEVKGDFQKEIKLPLIHDILERLYNASDADYLIYTNVDI